MRGTGIYSFFIVVAWLGILAGLANGVFFATEGGNPLMGLGIVVAIGIGGAIQLKVLGDLKWLVAAENMRFLEGEDKREAEAHDKLAAEIGLADL